MSGGTFDYKQYNLEDIADEIERRLKTIDVYLEDETEETELAVKSIMLTAIKKLKEARIYAHRLDWMFAGDDSPSCLIERLEEDLIELHEGKT